MWRAYLNRKWPLTYFDMEQTFNTYHTTVRMDLNRIGGYIYELDELKSGALRKLLINLRLMETKIALSLIRHCSLYYNCTSCALYLNKSEEAKTNLAAFDDVFGQLYPMGGIIDAIAWIPE